MPFAMLRRAQGMDYVRTDSAPVSAFIPVNSVRTKVYTPLQILTHNVMFISIAVDVFG